MVLAPIAAAAAPSVVASATDDEGLINKLFKIAVLIAVLVLSVISIVILSWVLDIANLLGAAGQGLSDFFSVFARPFGSIPIIGPVLTFTFAAFGFLGRRS
jgi:hypothetical protein